MKIAISKRGKNVNNLTNPNDFIFDSTFNTFKIIKTGVVSGTFAQSGFQTDETHIPHNQSTIPFVIAFCRFTDNRVGVPGTKDSAIDFWFANLYVDGTFIYFGYLNDTGADYTASFRYYIVEPILL